MRQFASKIDWLLLLPAIFLVCLSLLMLFSTSVTQTGTDWSPLIRQASYFLVGLFVFFFFAALDYRLLARYSLWFYLALLGLLVLTYFLGSQTRGSVRWIDLKFVTIQASEFAKPILIVFLAYFFAKANPNKIWNLILSIVILALPLGLILNQPDLGSSLVIISIWVSLVFVSGLNPFYFGFLLLVPLLSMPVFWHFLKDYQKARIETFLNPNSDPLGRGYNLVQAIIAVGSGQFFGRGLGRGTQSHLNFLPEQKTDFIFATSAEELGFVGIFLLLSLFAFLAYRLFSALSKSRDLEGSLIIVGCLVTIMVQVFINAGMNLGLLPITGITLPFVSFGGSSLISLFALLGLVESVLIRSETKQ